eukprot:PhM_4_TR4436/c0_g1_i1/m.442
MLLSLISRRRGLSIVAICGVVSYLFFWHESVTLRHDLTSTVATTSPARSSPIISAPSDDDSHDLEHLNGDHRLSTTLPSTSDAAGTKLKSSIAPVYSLLSSEWHRPPPLDRTDLCTAIGGCVRECHMPEDDVETETDFTSLRSTSKKTIY